MGIGISILTCLLWLIFTICAVINHFIDKSDSKKFKQDTYMFDDVRGKLVVSIGDDDPFAIYFYKMGSLDIDDNVTVSIYEESSGILHASEVFVNGYGMYQYCPKGMDWPDRLNYCISMMKTQGVASGQVSEKAIREIEKVQRHMNTVNKLIRERRLTTKVDKNGESYYFYNV